MANQIKVRLKSGEHEIEIEAAPGEVDRLLDAWWGSPGDSPLGQTQGESASRISGPSEKSARARSGSKSVPGSNGEFDPQEIVNSMREHEDYDTWESKVLHDRSLQNKVKFVAWFTDDYLTSGQIHAVLEGLGIKVDPSNASKALGKQASSFQQQGTRKAGAKPLYKLSSRARKEFGEWLKNDG